jgi:hypothetical protein
VVRQQAVGCYYNKSFAAVFDSRESPLLGPMGTWHPADGEVGATRKPSLSSSPFKHGGCRATGCRWPLKASLQPTSPGGQSNPKEEPYLAVHSPWRRLSNASRPAFLKRLPRLQEDVIGRIIRDQVTRALDRYREHLQPRPN